MRIVIAEDSVLLREGLTRLLAEAGHEVSAAVGHPEDFLRAVDEHKPDVVVVDVRMPPTFSDEGLRAALVVRARWPAMGVLVLSQYVEERYATELLSGRPHGVGYLLKDRVADVPEFLSALERVAAGGSALDSEVVAQLLARGRQPLDSLTSRSRAVRLSSGWRPRASNWATTSESSALPPAATRSSADRNSGTSATRSLSRYPTPCGRPDSNSVA